MRSLAPPPVQRLLGIGLLVFCIGACAKKPEQAKQSPVVETVAEKGRSPLPIDAAPARVHDTAAVERAVDQALDAWLAAQNRGDFAAYMQSYAPDFVGVRRSGSKTVELDLAGWRADRERMFKKPMTVVADHRHIHIEQDGVAVDFVQTWSSGTYTDRGPKQMRFSKDTSGPRILREEMLQSTILVTDQDALTALFPESVASERASMPVDCIPVEDGKGSWVCWVQTEQSGPHVAGTLALLRRVGPTYQVLDRHEREISTTSVGDFAADEATESASGILAGIRAIGRNHKAAELSLEAASSLEIESGLTYRAQSKALFWIRGDELIDVFRVTSSATSDTETDEASEESFEILEKSHGGFYDIRVTRRHLNAQWPVNDIEDVTEEEVLRWDDGYD